MPTGLRTKTALPRTAPSNFSILGHTVSLRRTGDVASTSKGFDSFSNTHLPSAAIASASFLKTSLEP